MVSFKLYSSIMHLFELKGCIYYRHCSVVQSDFNSTSADSYMDLI